MIAHAYASGLIVFKRGKVPGTLPITYGKADLLRKHVGALARRSYDGKQLLVPGIPEAASFQQRMEALLRFKALVDKRLGRPTFYRRIALHDIKVRAHVGRKHGSAA